MRRLLPRTRRGRRALLGIAAALVVVIAAETSLRLAVEHKVAGLARRQLDGGTVSASIGSAPALLDVARGHVGTLSLDADHVRLRRIPDVSVDATLHDLTLRGGHRVDGTDATVTLAPSSLTELAGRAVRLPGLSVTTSPQQGTLSFDALGGLAHVVERPELRGDDLSLVPQSATVFGRSLGASQVRQLGDRSASRPLSGLPFGLEPRAVRVAPTGLVISLHGGPTDLGHPEATN